MYMAPLSPQQLLALQATRREGHKRKNKYGAVRTGGHGSKKEHNRACTLQLMQRAGMISELREQVPFELIPAATDSAGHTIERACRYVADFVYRLPSGELVVEDAKGVRTDVYRIKRKLMLWRYGILIKET